MGGMLSQPVTDKRTNEGDGLGLRYGLSSMQGWRSEMEDAHDVKIGLKYGLEDWSYFAVFDGHAGKRAAAFAAWNLLEFILRDSKFKLNTENHPEHVWVEPDLEKLHDNIKDEAKESTLPEDDNEPNGNKASADSNSSNQDTTNKSSDQIDEINTSQGSTTTTTSTATKTQVTTQTSQLISSPVSDKTNKPENPAADKDSVPNLSKFAEASVKEQLDLVENAIKSGFLRIDQSMRETAQDMSGCTAVCTLISPTHVFIANCGDSRAVYFDGSVKFATEDHKPLNPKERKRIIQAGGCATQRINGTLAVSRALGDFEFKKDQQLGPCEQLVSPEPEVTVMPRNKDDMFLILACDGIWDVMDNYCICEYVQYKLQLEPSLKNVCSSVLDVCLHKGSRDNMSIIIVVFENGPRFSEKERDRDLENDKHIADAIRKFGEKHDDFNEFFYNIKDRFCDIRRHLRDMDAYLPPGAGLEAKYDLIHEIFVNEFEEKIETHTDVNK